VIVDTAAPAFARRRVQQLNDGSALKLFFELRAGGYNTRDDLQIP